MDSIKDTLFSEDILNTLEYYLFDYGMKILSAIIIIVIGFWVARRLVSTLNKIAQKRELDVTLRKFISNIVKNLLYVIVILAALDVAGFQTTSLIAVLGAAGLAVGLALQGSLSNFASGVMLIIFRPIKVGDYIMGGGESGTVENIGVFATTLTTPDNKVIIIPNSNLSGGNITNFSTKDTRRVDMVFGIGYQDDIDKAKEIINSILNSDTRILKDPATQVVVSSLGDSSVNFNVRPWVKSSDYWGVYFETTEKVKKEFDANGISIPFPQTDVHLYTEK